MKKELSVIIPAFNEEAAAGQVIKELRQSLDASGWQYEILLVDDGSSDETAKAAQAAGARVLSHPQNAGYGAALRTGLEAARYDLIATIDCDLSYPAGEILKLLPHALHYDMVIGSRQGRHFWGSMIKYPARIVFLYLARFVVGERIPDANSGLRIFKKSLVVEMLPRLCRGFSFSTTLTLSFMSSHYFVNFVPIAYTARVGASKVRYLRDTLRTIQLMLEAIVYYNPTKAVLLLVFWPFFASLACLAVFFGTGAIVWFLTSLFLFCWSLLLLGLGFILFMLAQIRSSFDKFKRSMPV